MARYRLRLSSLKFISAVDTPAQETALAVLTKRAGGELPSVQVKAKVVKLADELGVVFGWALTTKANGADYFDLHGDNIVEDDLIKVALEYVKAGAHTDAMHDREKDGWSPFVMPMTAEMIKSCLGVESPTSGLLIGMQPSAEVFAKFKSGELAGFSIDGLGYREEVTEKSAGPGAAKKYQTHSLYTDVVDGHQHQICVYDDGSMWVQHATMEGADNSHSHGIVRGENGALEILVDSGHTHQLADGQPAVVIVPQDAVIVVQASAAPPTNPKKTTQREQSPAAKSTVPSNPSKVDSMKTIVVLTEAQKAHHDKLADAEREVFLAKSFVDRESDVQKAIAADPEVYKTDSGVVIRKSHGDVALMLAKQADEATRQVAKANELAQAEKSARELSELQKRAKSTIGNLQGTDAAHCALLKAAESITDEKLREDAITALKAANALMATKSRAAGASGEDPADIVEKSASDKLEALVEKHATEKSVDHPTAWAAVMKTAEGKRLYAESVGRA